MLSYRHAFHAGNFADVLKHLILIQILGYLSEKDKAFCYIDTHAGPGDAALNSGYALKNREFENGIGKLWLRHDLPESVAAYVNLIKGFNPTNQLSRYPGSPLIAKHLLRPQDRLLLCELHSTEIQALTKAVNKDKRVTVYHADGLTHALGLLPPREHRGLVLIDPAYEIKSDYTQTIDALIKMTKRFATGIYALWYPVVERHRNEALEHAIQSSGIKNVQLFELGRQADTDEHGMTASGMIIINPPWTLEAQMQRTLPWLTEVLGQEGSGFYRVRTLVSE